MPSKENSFIRLAREGQPFLPFDSKGRREVLGSSARGPFSKGEGSIGNGQNTVSETGTVHQVGARVPVGSVRNCAIRIDTTEGVRVVGSPLITHFAVMPWGGVGGWTILDGAVASETPLRMCRRPSPLGRRKSEGSAGPVGSRMGPRVERGIRRVAAGP